MKHPFYGYLSVIIVLLLITGLPVNLNARESPFPFRPGERMVFGVRWAFIPAGEGILEVKPMEDFQGIPSYHFVFTARTNEFVDLIYKVRDRVDSWVDSGMTRSLRYKKRHQARSKKEVTVRFDWDQRLAQYSLFDEKQEPIPVRPGTFDPLSVFFAFRLYDPNTLKEIRIPVTDGKKCIPGGARVIRREQVDADGTTYDTFLVEPDLEHIGGVFKKSPNAKLKIWVTADHRHIPVRIESKVAVGSFVAELLSYEEGPVPDRGAE
jgi:hypothetical protein